MRSGYVWVRFRGANMNSRLKSQLIPDYAGQSADSYALSVLGMASLVFGMAQLFFIQYSTTISGIYLTFMHRSGTTRAEATFLMLMLPMMATLFGALGLYLSFNKKEEGVSGSGLCWAGFLLGIAWLFLATL